MREDAEGERVVFPQNIATLQDQRLTHRDSLYLVQMQFNPRETMTEQPTVSCCNSQKAIQCSGGFWLKAPLRNTSGLYGYWYELELCLDFTVSHRSNN